MLEQASRRGIYRRLHLSEIVEWLDQASRDSMVFDLILSADVFIYIGDLKPVFAAVRPLLISGGLFVFSVEHLAHGSVELRSNGRYAHSVEYVREMARAYHFKIEIYEEGDLRREVGEMIIGAAYVLS